MAVVTFGGAYAVLAYVAQEAVQGFGWLRPGEMLDGLGMAETTPGPLIMVTQFVGFLAAFREPGGLSPLLAGTLGGLLTTWVTFVPCFLWIFLGAPYIEGLRDNRALTAALAAITAAVVGVILNLAVWFALHVIFAEVRTVTAFGLDLDVPVWGSVNWAAALLVDRGDGRGLPVPSRDTDGAGRERRGGSGARGRGADLAPAELLADRLRMCAEGRHRAREEGRVPPDRAGQGDPRAEVRLHLHPPQGGVAAEVAHLREPPPGDARRIEPRDGLRDRQRAEGRRKLRSTLVRFATRSGFVANSARAARSGRSSAAQSRCHSPLLCTATTICPSAQANAP